MAKANKTVDTKENITGQDNQALGSEVTESKTEAVKQAPLIAKDIDLRQTVTIRNGFQGLLLYKDKRTGMDYRWEEFGDEQDMLRCMIVNLRICKALTGATTGADAER